jgi:hypothetical protein
LNKPITSVGNNGAMYSGNEIKAWKKVYQTNAQWEEVDRTGEKGGIALGPYTKGEDSAGAGGTIATGLGSFAVGLGKLANSTNVYYGAAGEASFAAGI